MKSPSSSPSPSNSQEMATENKCCCFWILIPKNAAKTAAVYTMITSMLVIAIYSWRINVDTETFTSFGDIYYGVQIAYLGIIGSKIGMLLLSILLLSGIHKENIHWVIYWIVGTIALTALEAASVVYSNVLRDYMNKGFDVFCRFEIAFIALRTFVDVVALGGVVKFYNLLHSGITDNDPEIIRL